MARQKKKPDTVSLTMSLAETHAAGNPQMIEDALQGTGNCLD